MKLIECYFIGIIFSIACTHETYQAESCFTNDGPGSCINIRNCPSAIEGIKNRKNPKICGFDGSDPIVCCVGGGPPKPPPTPIPTPPPKPVGTTARPSITTTEYIPTVNDYHSNYEGGCEPIAANLVSKKTGQKAWDKCIEYVEKYMLPCEKSAALIGGMSRGNNCKHKQDGLIVGGVDADLAEFPHMALLGFGDTSATAQWLCGGSIISERFIMTAGHCTSTRDFGPVSFAIVGTLKRNQQVDASKVYKIRRIIKHPDYQAPKKYNDLALLETETDIKMDQFVIPACLHTPNVDDINATATGWGALEYRGDSANTLQKVMLTKFTEEECSAKFPRSRNMENGFDRNSQICYGDRTMSKDTCQGDSGGPLQIKSRNMFCMYEIVGVTSFGKACGFVGEPGIYTRISNYVSWIESIVWA